MKVLVVYDSAFGNTEKIARSMGSALQGTVKVLKASEVSASELESLDFLVAGSPTYGGRPTQAMQDFLKVIPENALKGVSAASFDTRVPTKFVKLFGFAAPKIASDLKAKGAQVVASEGFFVKGKEGPLTDGETERASTWIKDLAKK
jgi:flavodoxin